MTIFHCIDLTSKPECSISLQGPVGDNPFHPVPLVSNECIYQDCQGQGDGGLRVDGLRYRGRGSQIRG